MPHGPRTPPSLRRLRQATGRALTFIQGDPALERDPLDAPGQPVGVLVGVLQEDEVVTASVDDTVAELVTTMTVGGLLALVTTAVAGTVVVRRALQPLEQVSAAASRVARLPLASGEVSLADQHVPAELAPPGTAVTAAVRATRDGWAEASVLDTGPGIPREFQARLFERFSRPDTSRQTREGSTGLGLSIVRSVVQAHGGTVDVESRPGRTLFTVRLPLSAAGGVPVPPR